MCIIGIPKATGNIPAIGHSNLPSHFIGGNHLEVAPPSNVKDFVASNDGHSVITSVRVYSIYDTCGRNGLILSSVGPYRQQRDRRRQGDSIREEMGLRDLSQ